MKNGLEMVLGIPEERQEMERRKFERWKKRGIAIVDMLALEGFSYAEGNRILNIAKHELSERQDAAEKTDRREIGMAKKKDDWIEEQNKKIIHWLWIIFVSMITALITTLVYTA